MSTAEKIILACILVVFIVFGFLVYGEIRAINARIHTFAQVQRIDISGGNLTEWAKTVQIWIDGANTWITQHDWGTVDPPPVPPPPPGWGQE